MDWKTIPSLASLRAFDGAARTGSLSEAARSLNVTHAAISQHLRALEAEFGVPLLDRTGKGVIPTAAGQILGSALADGFDRIAAGIEALRGEIAGRPLTVATTPTFAENWLMPRLGSFWAAHPEVEIALKPANRLADIAGGEADLAIRYGSGAWPGLQAEKLAPATFVVVASPTFTKINTLPACCWYFVERGFEHRKWAISHGLVTEGTRIEHLDSNALVLSAVRAGHGLTAQTRANVDADLASGALVALGEFEDEGAGYFLVTRAGEPSPALKAFTSWLKTDI
ncbi:LysR family transcriptional regulator [Aestuariibius insulae]|uniref:LysR family transcriptional regulator n=1 Tax=Aestuariibius insulae TaxID=2058287 RepID=UPI00345E662F